MTYIIAEPCIDIKDNSGADVCPVDCIDEFQRILIIDPKECIDSPGGARPRRRSPPVLNVRSGSACRWR